MFSKEVKLLILAGTILGFGALILVWFGNPSNMGICAACFLRDTSGGIGLHQNNLLQYVRPEILALALGAFSASIVTKQYKAVSSNGAIWRFLVAVCVMIGALVFLGCPTRMVLRIAGGDINAILGLIGFVFGLFIGYKFKQRGFSLGEEEESSKIEGFIFPFLVFTLLLFIIVVPSYFYISQTGVASLKAPFVISFGMAFIIGIFAYQSKFCFVSGFARPLFKKEYKIALGILAFFSIVLIGNLILGNFKLSFDNQPIAHNDGLFNFLSMIVVGWGSMMLIGCPFRQIIKAGSGNINSAIVIFGFLIGASISHNFSLASTPSGVTLDGKIATIAILILFTALAIFSKKHK